MNQLFAYESDDEPDDARASTSPKAERAVERQPASRGWASNAEPNARPRSSRWAQKSAFLAPVAYDANDADLGDDESDDGGDSDAIGDGSRDRRQGAPASGGSHDAALALKRLLPAPVNETRDRNAPGDSSGGAVTGNVTSSHVEGRKQRPSIDAAPMIVPGVSPYPVRSVPEAHGAHDHVPLAPLPAGAVIKEISAGDLRGPPGGGSLASVQDLEMAFRANAARGGTVSKQAKRKNQLSALLSEAKATADEHREKRADGASLRSATRMKYGWG
jgi:hypothetical protein